MKKTVESTQEKVAGSRPAASVIIAAKETSSKYTADVFRISPDKIMLIQVLPDDARKLADVQAVLNSLVFSRQEKLIMPSTSPATVLAPVPNWCIDK